MLIVSASDDGASVGGKATFGFEVKCCPTTGNLVYHDHALNVDIKATSVNFSDIFCPGARFGGTAKVKGVGSPTQGFNASAADNGEPGSAPTVGPDQFSISTSDGYFASGYLIGGNIQCQPEGTLPPP